MMDPHESLLNRAAKAIAEADALLIGAGAGMGVDSGLPDFRGDQGFWKAYPAYEKLRLDFVSLANPRWFATDPSLAWGFYGHRRNLYRETRPHEGFHILKTWAGRMRHGAFVYTSNVDGHFQKAGFPPESVLEVHGAIDWMQCTRECGVGVFPAPPEPVKINHDTMRACAPMPTCPSCGAMARPNILMFGDADWDYSRTYEQEQGIQDWFLHVGDAARLVVLECGAGTAVPTVRRLCELAAIRPHRTLIRINVRESLVPDEQIGLPMAALEALRAIDDRLGAMPTQACSRPR